MRVIHDAPHRQASGQSYIDGCKDKSEHETQTTNHAEQANYFAKNDSAENVHDSCNRLLWRNAGTAPRKAKACREGCIGVQAACEQHTSV